MISANAYGLKDLLGEEKLDNMRRFAWLGAIVQFKKHEKYP